MLTLLPPSTNAQATIAPIMTSEIVRADSKTNLKAIPCISALLLAPL
jgi:hypothetical protein